MTVLDGFVRSRWSKSKRAGGTAIAFCDFGTHDQAAAALVQLQGATLPSVPSGVGAKFSEVTPKRTRAPEYASYGSYAPQASRVAHGSSYAGSYYGSSGPPPQAYPPAQAQYNPSNPYLYQPQ